MATPAACLRSPLAPPRSYHSPPFPLPNPLRSRRSTPCSRCRSLLGRPRGAPSFLRRCLPVHRGPVAYAPYPPSSSPAQLSPSPSLPLCAAFPKRPRSVLPLLLVSALPPAGPCGHSPLPSRSFHRLRPPILLIGKKMLAIRQAGFVRLGWWRAGPRPAGKAPEGLA